MVLFTSLSRVQGNHMGFLVRENDWSEIYSGIHCSACRHRYIVNVNYNWRTIRELQWLMNHEFHKPWWQVNIPDYRKVFLRYYHTLWRYWFTDRYGIQNYHNISSVDHYLPGLIAFLIKLTFRSLFLRLLFFRYQFTVDAKKKFKTHQSV